MAHYAFIKDGIVTEVITGVDENATENLPGDYSSWEEFYLTQRPGQDACKRTSYNTYHNEHLLGGTPFRGNYAGIGFSYDEANDIFVHPKFYNSWVFDVATASWKPPVDKPADANDDHDTSLPRKQYDWNEDTVSWDFIKEWNYNTETSTWEEV